jgi:DNA-binding beta-propeller fold protein YncE
MADSPPAVSETHVGAGKFRYRVEPKWTIPCDRGYGEIVGVACDSRDRVFLFARGSQLVLVFEPDGTFVTGWELSVFARPHGIFIGPDDTVYTTDDNGHAIRAFTGDGKTIFSIHMQYKGLMRGKIPGTKYVFPTTIITRNFMFSSHTHDGPPSDTGAIGNDYRTIQRAAEPFNYPTNLAVGPTGDLFISDGYGNARVHRFSPESGHCRHSFGEPGTGPGQFQVPHGIAVDTDGTIYVADRENSRIQRFTADGTYIDEWSDVARPCQVFIDRAGWVYVAELGYHAGQWPGNPPPPSGAPGGRVSIFDRKGVLQARWGGTGDPCAAGNFFAPHDIWVDSTGAIYVAEVTLSGGGGAGLVPASCHTLQKFVPIAPVG